jgi:hypothetical protein
MFNHLVEWYRHRQCLLHGHTPRHRRAYCRRGPDGREYLEARDCIHCPQEHWFLRWVDFDVDSLQAVSLYGAPSLAFPMLDPQVIVGHGKRVLQGQGWKIIEEPLAPPPVRLSQSGGTLRRRRPSPTA